MHSHKFETYLQIRYIYQLSFKFREKCTYIDLKHDNRVEFPE